jgi:antitoxin CptB
MSASGPAELAKLRWRCRRGMRELDTLLLGFLDRGYVELDSQQKRCFDVILALPDPDLHAYLVGKAHPTEPGLADVLERIRGSVSAPT